LTILDFVQDESQENCCCSGRRVANKNKRITGKEDKKRLRRSRVQISRGDRVPTKKAREIEEEDPRHIQRRIQGWIRVR
jgi:hypothetical protein